jgi:hypothetical protein
VSQEIGEHQRIALGLLRKGNAGQKIAPRLSQPIGFLVEGALRIFGTRMPAFRHDMKAGAFKPLVVAQTSENLSN